MHHEWTMFAALDPEGSFAAVCGITWTLLCPTSAVAAIVALILCLFRRTARQAFRLSKLGLWTGIVAATAAAAGTFATISFPTNPPQSVSDAVILVLLTCLAPAVAFAANRVSRRKLPAAPPLDATADAAPVN